MLARIAGVSEARVNEIAVGPIQALLDLLPAR
jgi:enoyl-[acyl-carrier-protein] reductase (NADH)